jgi:two-component sensor histidine kinase
LFFAARELVRNAADHARGDQLERDLCLEVHLALAKELCLVIEDNGIGYQQDADTSINSELSRRKGSGNGLRIHSALLAAVGASLEISNRPEGGTRAVIRVSHPAQIR